MTVTGPYHTDRPRDAPRWRVDYHLWTPGGRLRPHSTEVRAVSEADAIADAERLERAHAARAGRSHCGYFKDATAERLEGGS